MPRSTKNTKLYIHPKLIFKHMSPVIDVRGLSKAFGKYLVLEDLSLQISAGEIYGLVGLNGAGKTTLIRLLLGVLKPDRGALSVLGRDPWLHDASLYRHMGVVLEHDGFWGNCTFKQNMKIFAAAKGVAWADAAHYIEEFWGGANLYKNKKAVKYFSRGQRMQCALCRAFLGQPSVYLFDEPAVALDVGAYDRFAALVKRARDNGSAIVISSHHLEAIDDLAGRVGMLHDKRLAELPQTAEGGGGELWSLGADRNAAWAAVIRSVCKGDPTWSNGEWRFEALPASIPELVKRLVEAGCRVGKVAPCGSGFSATIRREYREKAAQNGRAAP
jgi:ABC-type multidrug transport system ATPase subunit